MPIIRIDNHTNYTTIQNSLLRDSRLSLKACGLLCKMLSHCDSWNFTINGLAASTKDGRTTVSGALKELEELGYLVRKIVRDHFGRICDTEYWIYDSPEAAAQYASTVDGKSESGNTEPEEEPADETPETSKNEESAPIEAPVFFEIPEAPFAGIPDMDEAEAENCTQRNNNIRNTKVRNNIYKNSYNSNSSIYLSSEVPAENRNADVMEYEEAKRVIRENVEYETVCEQYPQERVDEIVEIAAEVVCMPRKTITLGTSVYPFAIAKDRILRLTANHVRYIIDSINGITHKIRHIKPYLTKTILEAETTIHTYRSNDTTQESGFANSSFDTDSFFAAALTRAYGN